MVGPSILYCLDIRLVIMLSGSTFSSIVLFSIIRRVNLTI